MEPGLQVYSGIQLNHPVHATLSTEIYLAYSGLGLEPQGWSDALNNPCYPSAILQTGALYRHVSRLSFSKTAIHGG
ncbi:hypothetical protein [Ruegeria arenilitoris]|uniref:hypothetical protein n=1 Tax=Ruegeria arenilitoris TaxID=1173585 RepID=UPI00147AA3AF|nr:hypothetical protein [Ruegeria arenilitoris]